MNQKLKVEQKVYAVILDWMLRPLIREGIAKKIECGMVDVLVQDKSIGKPFIGGAFSEMLFTSKKEAQAACTNLREALRRARVIK